MPDLTLWRLADAMTVEQAACLWVGADPAGNRYARPPEERDQIAAVQQTLTAAIRAGELDADTTANVLANIGNHSESLVKRAALRDFAKRKNQYPAFLFDTILPENEAGNTEATEPPAPSGSQGGRPPEYDWDAFIIEIIRIADLDALPDKQSELIERMLQWCEDTWGEQPSLSVAKERISKIYKGLGRGRKPRLMGSP